MAERPVFVPAPDSDELVQEVYLPMRWHSGFAVSQKRKNVLELHRAAAAAGYSPVLEVSTKSTSRLGQHLSAFHLKVSTNETTLPLENAFQGSKVFEKGGPFVDLYHAQPRVAKSDSRLRTSGRLIGFDFKGVKFPAEPMTAFYDWLYIGSIYPHREWLTRLNRYAAFSDIEFNPERSVNCQARSCALFVSLTLKGVLNESIKSPEAFLSAIGGGHYGPGHVDRSGQRLLISDEHAADQSRKASGLTERPPSTKTARNPRRR